LEKADTNKSLKCSANGYTASQEVQVSFNSNAESEIVEKLKGIDVNTLTPIEAMGILYELAREAGRI